MFRINCAKLFNICQKISKQKADCQIIVYLETFYVRCGILKVKYEMK